MCTAHEKVLLLLLLFALTHAMPHFKHISETKNVSRMHFTKFPVWASMNNVVKMLFNHDNNVVTTLFSHHCCNKLLTS